jgi:hypothetical protein
MGYRITGTVTSFGEPVLGARVALTSDLATLGSDPRAVVDLPGAVTWTRLVMGWSGNHWNAWQKFVARDVAGMAWEDFRALAARYNPSLRLSDDEFRAEEAYALPENRTFADTREAAPTITWDRTLIGFAGSQWDCWQLYVQGKVVGLNWHTFTDQVAVHNPQLAASGGRFDAGQTYNLPQNAEQQGYLRVAYGDPTGAFVFEDLPAGSYRLEIVADGYRRLSEQITISGDLALAFELETTEIVVTKGDQFVQPAGRLFHIGGRSFRFIGVNLRGLVHYGTSVLPHASAREQLDAARSIGVKAIRIFLPHRDVPVEEIKSRFRNTIDLLKREYPEMYLVVALTNLYGDVGFNVPGDWGFGPGNKGAYTLSQDGHDLLAPDWFQEGYKRSYVHFVEDVLKTFRNEPTIMAWNIGNELKAQVRPDLLVNFMLDMAGKMRAWDPNHMISTGMISTRHAFMEGRQDLRERLYSSSAIDFITNHAYHGDDNPNTNLDQENQAHSREDDHDLSLRFGKPLLVEEAGFKAPGMNRRDLFARELDHLMGGDASRAAGYMPWGFMAGQDNGDGDNELGIDQKANGIDWHDVTGLLSSWSGRLAGETHDVGLPTSKLIVGQKAFAAAGLRLRAGAGTDQAELYKMPQRGEVRVTGPMVERNGLRWWPVSLVTSDGRTLSGWMAQTDLNGNVTLTA